MQICSWCLQHNTTTIHKCVWYLCSVMWPDAAKHNLSIEKQKGKSIPEINFEQCEIQVSLLRANSSTIPFLFSAPEGQNTLSLGEIFWTSSFTCWGSCKLSIYESPHQKCISFTQTLESQMYLCAITVVYIIGMNYEPWSISFATSGTSTVSAGFAAWQSPFVSTHLRSPTFTYLLMNLYSQSVSASSSVAFSPSKSPVKSFSSNDIFANALLVSLPAKRAYGPPGP